MHQNSISERSFFLCKIIKRKVSILSINPFPFLYLNKGNKTRLSQKIPLNKRWHRFSCALTYLLFCDKMGKKRKRIIYPKNWRHRNDCNILDVEGWCTAEKPSWRESDYLQPIRGRNLSDGQTHKRSQITSNDTRDNRTDEARLIEGRVTFNALPKWKAHVSWIFLSINATPSLLRSCATSVYNGFISVTEKCK